MTMREMKSVEMSYYRVDLTHTSLTEKRCVCVSVSRFMDLCAHSVFVYVVDLLVVLVSVA